MDHCSTLIPDHCDYNHALAPTHVAFRVEDLLPCAQGRLPAGDWNGLRRSQQRCLQMRVPIAVMPRLLMAIIAAGRNEFVQDARQILLQAGLELTRAQRISAVCTSSLRSSRSAPVMTRTPALPVP